VDDDWDLLRGLNVRLKASGYDVVHAGDGLSATNQARQEKPDLIILDLGIPGGDGFKVMERLKTFMPLASIPIIVLTGRDPMATRDRALHAGAEAFFQKPVDNEILLTTIARILGQVEQGEEEVRKTSSNMNAKILIVDDDQDLLHGLSIRLRASGYNVVFAADAATAVSRTRQEKPNLIILDLGLPGGDGFMVMKKLNTLMAKARIPIIVFSGRDPIANRERALNYGAKAFLQKPVDNVELLATIERTLEESRQERASRKVTRLVR